ALKVETDDASKDRLARLEKELVGLEEESTEITAKWQAEKQKLGLAADLKKQLDEARNDLAIAQRKGEFQRAGELAYGKIPELEKKLKEAEAQDGKAGMVEEVVTPDHVAHIVSRWTGIPVDKMLQGERDKLLRMEDEIGKRVVGQGEAVQAVSKAVRRRPYQVVLFDEIEKAHPDVFNVLLQVLDDGRLTDGQGRTVDFRNTLIIMTSNLGAEYLVNLTEDQDVDLVRDEVMNVVRASFRPEFLNRVDEVILFHRLRRQDMGRIVEIQLKRLESLLVDRKITLSLDQEAVDWLAAKGYDPAYGARPLKRVMQKELQDPLAEKILVGDILDGSTVKVTAGSDRLNFRSKPTIVAAEAAA
ncbi:hypothetical protein EOA22_27060, partial [Mesorhizobium sp. M7A.F.Ca.US.014.04.1.1]|uniref:AAA family ATPase n=1 Tax=Mesorhizobium sp. M7A.F.Ca.US.014.04.1.1 TaxID=2496744 RepID=UPI000FD49423